MRLALVPTHVPTAGALDGRLEDVHGTSPQFPSVPASWSQASSRWAHLGQQLVIVDITDEQALEWARSGVVILDSVPDARAVMEDMVKLPRDYQTMLNLKAERELSRGTWGESSARTRMFNRLRSIADRGFPRRREFTDCFRDQVVRFEREWFGGLPGVVAMATLTSDGFSGSNTSEINGRTGDAAGGGTGASWQQAYGQLGITSNKCRGVVDLGWYRDNGMSSIADQRITLKHETVGRILMTMGRCAASAIDGYAADSGYYGAGSPRLWKWSGGGLSQIGGAWSSSAAGDLISIECVGTTISVLKNGASLGSVTDSTFTAGRGGICHYWVGYDTDDYLAESIVASGGGPPSVPLETSMVQLRR